MVRSLRCSNRQARGRDPERYSEFRIIEAHPVGGQYDWLLAPGRGQTWLWDVNREGGLHLHSGEDGQFSRYWPGRVICLVYFHTRRSTCGRWAMGDGDGEGLHPACRFWFLLLADEPVLCPSDDAVIFKKTSGGICLNAAYEKAGRKLVPMLINTVPDLFP